MTIAAAHPGPKPARKGDPLTLAIVAAVLATFTLSMALALSPSRGAAADTIHAAPHPSGAPSVTPTL